MQSNEHISYLSYNKFNVTIQYWAGIYQYKSRGAQGDFQPNFVPSLNLVMSIDVWIFPVWWRNKCNIAKQHPIFSLYMTIYQHAPDTKQHDVMLQRMQKCQVFPNSDFNLNTPLSYHAI